MNLRFSTHYQHSIPSAQTMRQISRDINARFALNKSPCIPKLVILPVDPWHLHAYWDLDYEHNIKASALILRIYWHPDGFSDITQSRLWFEFGLKHNQGRRNFQLPVDGSLYSAAIGQRNRQQQLAILIRSNTIESPRARVQPLNPAPAFSARRYLAKSTPTDGVVNIVRPRFFDEALINAQIKQNILKRHRVKAGREQLPLQTNGFDQTVIDALIKKTLADKGQVSPRPIHSPTSTPDTHFAASNASGQHQAK